MNDSLTMCTLCGTTGAATTTTTLRFTDEGASVSVAGVPASGCSTCDDVAISGPLALAIERDARHILAMIAGGAPDMTGGVETVGGRSAS